jgi:hypothetical protein
MKDTNPARPRETAPTRSHTERPDNGFETRRRFGPSSDSYKDNPHLRLKLAKHASCSAQA